MRVGSQAQPRREPHGSRQTKGKALEIPSGLVCCFRPIRRTRTTMTRNANEIPLAKSSRWQHLSRSGPARFVPDYDPALHYKGDMLQEANIGQGVPFNRHEIGQFARFD